MEANNVNVVYEEGSKKAVATRADLVKSLRKGDTVAVLHVFLLADPARKRKRDDLWQAVDEIEARGAAVLELHTGLRSSHAKQRDEMMRAAVEALAAGRHKTKDGDKRGRPSWAPTEPEKALVKAIWESRRHKTWQDAVDAVKAVDARWSPTRLYKTFGPRNEND